MSLAVTMMSHQFKVDDWVYLHEDFNHDNVFDVEMVDSFGRVKVSAWLEAEALIPFVEK